MISEILKKIEIKTNPLLIAVLVVLIVARARYVSDSMVLNFAIILLSVYLAIIFIAWAINANKQKEYEKRCKQEILMEEENRNRYKNEHVWNYFLGLSDENLQFFIDLINLPEAGSKYKRVVLPNSPLKYQLINDDFQVQSKHSIKYTL